MTRDDPERLEADVSDVTSTYPGGELPLARVPATVGSDGLDISSLLKTTGAVTLDGGFTNTASCTSAITFIDGDAGILRYRGYPIEQLAAHSTLPRDVVPAHLRRAADRRPSSPSSRRASSGTRCCTRTCAGSSTASRATRTRCRCSRARCRALSTFYQDSLDPFDPEQVEISTVRLLAKVPTIAAYAYKKSVGQPFLYPDNSLSLNENFLRMTFGVPAEHYDVDPVARARRSTCC